MALSVLDNGVGDHGLCGSPNVCNRCMLLHISDQPRWSREAYSAQLRVKVGLRTMVDLSTLLAILRCAAVLAIALSIARAGCRRFLRRCRLCDAIVSIITAIYAGVCCTVLPLLHAVGRDANTRAIGSFGRGLLCIRHEG